MAAYPGSTYPAGGGYPSSYPQPQPARQPVPYTPPAPAQPSYTPPAPAPVTPARTAPTQPAYTPPVAQQRNSQYASQIANAYKQYLGRDATQAEISARLNDPGFNVTTHVQSIMNSQEAANYRQRQAMQAQQAQAAPTQKYTVAGMEASKLADTSYTKSPKYVIGRVMETIDPKSMYTAQGQAAFLQKLRASDPNGFYKDARISGDKLVYTGQQGQRVTLDLLNSYDAGKATWQYLTSDPNNGKPASGAGASAGGSVLPTTNYTSSVLSGGGGGVGTGSTVSTGKSTVKNPMEAEIMAKVRSLINQDPTDVSLQDKTIRPQLNAFALLRNRLREKGQENAAEAMAAQGLSDSGAMDNERRMLQENYADDVSNYGAGLVGNEVQARRQEVVQALEQGAGLYTAEQERSLRSELARLDDATRRYGIQQQASTAAAELNQRLKAMMLQNEQFNKDLGFRIGDREAAYNQNAWTAFAGY